MRVSSARLIGVLVTAAGVAVPAVCIGQTVPAPERAALVRLGVERGAQPDEVERLVRQADDVAAKGLPASPLVNKIQEGLAKGHSPARIEPLVRQIAGYLETAGGLMREIVPSGPLPEMPVTLLAEAIGGGVTPDEVREMRRLVQAPNGPALSPDAIANAAKALAFIRDAGLPVDEGTGVIVASVRQGHRPHETLDIGREIKRRERDYREGRASLRALRDAIARGDRPSELFRDARVAPIERPNAERPAPTARPERPQRPERPEAPERPETGRAR